MPFKKGNNANPKGRPIGSKNKHGMAKVYQMFADLVSDDENLEKFKIAIQAKINANAMKVWKELNMPLLPRHIEVKETGEFDTDASDAAKKMSDDELDKI